MASRTGLTVLLIDDDDVVWESVRRSFRTFGLEHGLVCVADGIEALDILRGQHADKTVSGPLVLLLDLNMPRMNGFEFLSELRSDASLSSHVVFVLTTSDDERDRTRAYAEHVAGYMVKEAVGPQFAKLSCLLGQFRETVELPYDA